MPRKLLWILCVLVLAALACNAPTFEDLEDTGIGQPTGTVSIQPTDETPEPTSEAVATAVLPTAIGSDPQFIGPIQFTDNADALIGGFAFAEGIEEIWAIWQYANMREGLSVRRVWYLDGEVWIDRTVEWDFAKYGASGSVRDVSIFDHDAGLPAGEYKLELYIDGRLQDIAGNTEDGRAAFNIVGTVGSQSAFPSPSGSKTITISDEQGILECEGCSLDLRSFHAEIVDVDWFPDERYILYTTIDRTEQIGGSTIGLKWQLWMLDWDTGDTYPISEPDERFHDAAISPEGKTIAAAAGTGYGDAGNMDLRLAFLSIDANYQRTATRYADEFLTIPENMQHSVYPTAAGSYPLPGKWQSESKFVSPLAVVGFETGFEAGLYEFDLLATTANRIGDLP